MMNRQFFRKLAQNLENIQTFCNDRRNLFHFACGQWYSYNNPQYCLNILTSIQILLQINVITPIQIYLFLYLFK